MAQQRNFNGFTTRFLSNIICLLMSSVFFAVLLSKNRENKIKTYKWNTFFPCYEVSTSWYGDETLCLTVMSTSGEVYGFRLSCKCASTMNVYTLLLVLKSSTNQQSQHVHFAKLYKIALIVKSSDHNIALTHQEVLPCEKTQLEFQTREEALQMQDFSLDWSQSQNDTFN